MDYQELNLQSGDLLTAAHMAHIEEGIDTVTAEVAKLKTAKIVLRNDTTDNWVEVEETVILLKGEPAIEFTADGATKMKIGDGVTAWKDLPYFSSGSGSSSGDSDEPADTTELTSRVTTLEETVTGFDTRIQNAESGVTAAVITADETAAEVETFKTEVNTSLEEQAAIVSAAQTKVDENTAIVEAISAEMETIKNTQDTQQMEIETANSRVDTLVAGFTDNAEFDNAELIDIRAGYDGVTYTSAGAAVRQIGYDLNELSQNLVGALGKDIVDGLGYEGNKLYLTANGEMVGEPVTIVSGGTGGGATNQTYTITLMNLLDSRVITMTADKECILEFSYHSIDEDGYGDGPGIGYIFVNNSQIATTSIIQGTNTFDITSFLGNGENSIKIQVENSEGAKKTLTYTVNVLVLAVTSTAPKMGLYKGQVSLPYTVTGSGTKLVRFYLDEREIAQETVATSGNSRVIALPEQTDGAHILEIQAEVSNGSDTIRSNKLAIGMLYYSDSTTTQAILLMDYEGPTEVEQGATLLFPYMVYDPFLQTTDINLNIYEESGELYKSFALQVDQSPKEWVTQDYPAGLVKFEIVCKDTTASQSIQVAPTSFDKEIITDSCVLDFNARGRSNNEANPKYWEYNGITAEFDGFGWANVDGWYDTSSGQTALRFLPGDTMSIDYKPFEEDFRVSGYTIEAEFETHNVRDYDSVIISSLNSGRGLSIKSQSASLASEQSSVAIQFKEDSRVRIAFVIEQLSLYRFVYIYVNGVMCGVIQYPENDDFAQVEPVTISIGAESCGLDLYSLRMYNKGFTRHEQLNNFICDRPTLAERIEANKRNAVLNDNDQVAIANLPPHLPYMIIECEELPQFKGDKKKDKSVTYVEPLKPERNFTATGVQLDVQGTSSAGYPVKNYKVSLKGGLTYTNSGDTAAGFPIIEGGLEGKVICLKADFASSEQANNIMLVDYYEMLSPYKTPAQELDERVRTAVRGFPCVVFWKNTTDNSITFVGKYNFNDDKSNENVFGFDRDIYPNCECWEFCNNTSDRVLFNKSEYEEWGVDDDNNPIEAWRLDFEPRFPDLDDPYKDYTQFKRMTDWVVSTNRTLATDEDLGATVTLPHWNTGISTQFSTDSVDYRLSKFKAEFEDYFIKDAMVYYYLFTEVFILTDNRAKNLFLTTFDGSHWFPIPYDMDTAIGINNEGALVFEYDLEDTDTPNGANVFTGQNSALWHNVRDCFAAERRAMYQELRSGNSFNYETINNKMRDHQSAWPEAIWNEDEYNKYIGSLINKKEDYLEMLQGDKKAQRDWWLYNGFKYRDSKYNAGDALTNYITLRCYEVGNITVTPYSHICPRIKYGSVYAGGERVKRNTPVELICTQDEMDDTEVYIYSADRIASVGDLSHLKVGLAVFSAATKLQDIILGSEAEGYENPNLYSLEVGNNELLTLVNVTNCTSDKFTSLDVSGCHGLETVKAKGTKLTGISLPNGGHLTTLELPATIANLTIQNQKNIKTLSLESQENLSTLRIEGTPGLPIETLINNSPSLNRVRLTNIEWNATDESTLRTTIDKLIAAKGLDADGLNLDKAVVTGRVHITTITESFLEEINDNFPELVVVVNGVAQYFVRYADWDNTLLYRYIAAEGTAAIDPIEAGYIETPVREDTETAQYVYKGWSENPTSINRPYSIIAKYSGTYMATFYNDAEEVIYQEWVEEGADVADPVEAGLVAVPSRSSTEKYDYYYSHWTPNLTNIQAPTYFYPVFEEKLRTYWVYFTDEGKATGHIYGSCQVYYGGKAVFPGDANEVKKYINGEPSEYYEFIGWSDNIDEEVTDLTYIVAQFNFVGYIEDSWETIIAACQSGDVSNYSLGARKLLTFEYSGEEVTVEMELVGINHDTLATVDENYNGGASTAALSWLTYVMLPKVTSVNSESKNYSGNDGESHRAGGGWELSDLRAELNGALLTALDSTGVLQAGIKPVIKYSDHGYYHQDEEVTTVDSIWAPSTSELNYEASSMVVDNQGAPYKLYTDTLSRRKFLYNSNTSSSEKYVAYPYWTRSSYSIPHQWYFIAATGYPSSMSAGNSQTCYVCFGFCL